MVKPVAISLRRPAIKDTSDLASVNVRRDQQTQVGVPERTLLSVGRNERERSHRFKHQPAPPSAEQRLPPRYGAVALRSSSSTTGRTTLAGNA